MRVRAGNFAEKLVQVRNLIGVRLPSVDVQNLVERMSKLGHYHYNRKSAMLFGVDRELYNLLIENGYNPYTVYRWLLLERIPESIRWQLKQHQINQKQAITLSLQQRKETSSPLATDIKTLGMRLIGGM